MAKWGNSGKKRPPLIESLRFCESLTEKVQKVTKRYLFLFLHKFSSIFGGGGAKKMPFYLECLILSDKLRSTSNDPEASIGQNYFIVNTFNPVKFYQTIQTLPDNCVILEISPTSSLAEHVTETRRDIVTNKYTFFFQSPAKSFCFIRD